LRRVNNKLGKVIVRISLIKHLKIQIKPMISLNK
jgi:hypothetical protein